MLTTVVNMRDKAAVAKAEKAGQFVYVGREPSGLGKWGNKYTHLRSRVAGVVFVMDRQTAIDRHRADTLANPELLAAIRKELKGKVLGCWCHPLPCHAHTLAAIANEKV